MTISQNPEACCNQNCRSGRDCPNRQPRDLNKQERVGLLLFVLAWVAVFAAAWRSVIA